MTRKKKQNTVSTAYSTDGSYRYDGSTCNVRVVSTNAVQRVCGILGQNSLCEFHYLLNEENDSRSRCRSTHTGAFRAAHRVQYAELMHKLVQAVRRQYGA